MSCPTMLSRVAEDAGSLLRMVDRIGVQPWTVARRPPGELAQAVQNCLECFDQALCEELVAQTRQLPEVPTFCANGRLDLRAHGQPAPAQVSDLPRPA